ncbi:MAG: PKD domain-containing protein [Chitinophagaceae bacterium]
MKRIVLLLFIFLCSKTLLAFHLKGGWIQYEFIKSDALKKTNTYKVTVRQYLSCTSNGNQIDADVVLGIFDGGTNAFIQKITIPLSSTDRPSITTFDPCITPKPSVGSVCYRIDNYVAIIEFPFNDNGYTLAVQRCCRIGGIINIVNSDQFGITYSNKIPGSILGASYSQNSSPLFQQKDTVIVCHNTPFTFDFSATDADGDSLAYVFCDGLHGGNSGGSGAKPDPPANPPYQSVAYSAGFSGTMPMGAGLFINPITGLINGIAPDATGEYVVAVCALEYRNGILIGSNKKEIHINVANCELSAATLKPDYITCDGFTMSFQNENTATNITSYKWDFGVTNSLTDTSTQPTPTYTYADTGVYTLKLVVASLGCRDSATALVRVYPGFTPNFTFSGFCFQNPFLFNNTTIAKYGFVDSVHWDFGEPLLQSDTSIQKNTSYKYLTPGDRRVTLYAHSSKGCYDTISKVITVLDKPTIKLAFKDTLICSIDTLQLQAFSNAPNYSWSPNSFILNTTSPNPLTFPKDTTLYILTVTDNGCINKDTVKVNVLDFITVDAGINSNICLTDGFKMQTNSFALGYSWSPSLTLNDSTLKYPTATPTQAVTTYYVKANLGKCQDQDSVTLFAFPYPKVTAGANTSICRGQSVQISGVENGNTFYWSPGSTLSDSTILNPIATPAFTTNYILTVQNLTGCLKPVRDTTVVDVIQPFSVFAGRDTSVVIGQPLQLQALVSNISDKKFTWTSNTNTGLQFLSNPNLDNPIAIFSNSIDSVVYVVKAYTKEDCFATDDIRIKVFKSLPDIFVPDAFTPNNDGKNDIIKPTPVGITRLDYFNIYNRWGQMLFTTNEIGKGWDGSYEGKTQSSGTFIYTVQGQDYLGKVITKKGTVVLIR